MVLRALRSDTLSLAERSKYWDLGVKLARELGSAVEPTPVQKEPTPLRAHAAAADYG
jgi:hypothetical protein